MRRQLNELITQLLSSRTAKVILPGGGQERSAGMQERSAVMKRGVFAAKVQWEIPCLCKWQSQRGSQTHFNNC